MRETLQEIGGQLQCQSRLTDATGAGESEQAYIITQEEIAGCCKLHVSSDQGSTLNWQIGEALIRGHWRLIVQETVLQGDAGSGCTCGDVELAVNRAEVVLHRAHAQVQALGHLRSGEALGDQP